MFGRLWGKSDQPKATKANLGEASSMYYDEEKKKWRERGKEHLEEEEKELAPPPISKPKEEKDGSPQPPKPELTGVDALIAPPNPYMNRLGNKGGAKPPVASLGAPPEPAGEDGEQSAGPPSNPFGATMPAAGAANPFGPRSLAAAQPFNPNAPRGVATSPNPNDPSDTPAEGGANSSNPFGQRNLAGAQPFNPNAPRSVAGGPGPNPNAPRARRQAQAKPRPPAAARSPFAAAPVGGAAPPELSGGDPEGGDDTGGRPEQPKDALAGSRRAPPAALAEEEEPDTAAAPAVPASPFGSHMPAYSPLSAPARAAVAPGLPPLRTRVGPFAANGPGAEGLAPVAPPQDAEGAGHKPGGAEVAGEALAGQETAVSAPLLAGSLQATASFGEEVPPALAEAAATEPEVTAPMLAATSEPEVSLLAEMAAETEVQQAAPPQEADAALVAQTPAQADPFMAGEPLPEMPLEILQAQAPQGAPAEVAEELAGLSQSVEPAGPAVALESSAWGEDLGDLLGGVATEPPMQGALPQEPLVATAEPHEAAEVAPAAAEVAQVTLQSEEQPLAAAPQDAGWDIELEGFEDKPPAAPASEETTTAAEAERPAKEAGGSRELTLSNGESTSSWVLLTGEAQAEALVPAAAAPNGPADSEPSAPTTEESTEVAAALHPEAPAADVSEVVLPDVITDVATVVAEEAKAGGVDSLFGLAPDVNPPRAEVVQEQAAAVTTLPPVAANGPDLVDLAGEGAAMPSEGVTGVPEVPAAPAVPAMPTVPDSIDWSSTPAAVTADEPTKGAEAAARVFSMDGAAAVPTETLPAETAPEAVPDTLDSWFATPPAPEPAKGDLAEVFSMDAAEAPPAAAAAPDSVDGWFSEPTSAPLLAAPESAPLEVHAPPPAAGEATVDLLFAPAEKQAPAPPEPALHEEEAPPPAAAEPAPWELQESTLPAQEVPAPAPAAAEPALQEAAMSAMQEAELAELRTRAAELERQLAELRRQAAAREEELQAAQCLERAQRERAEAALAEAKGQLEAESSHVSAPVRAEGDEEFNLPDFVWSCGNSEVMAFVQKIVGENASLRRQVALAPATLTPALPAAASPPFVAQGASAESAAAFAGGVSADDGHQIPSLLALLDEHAGDLKVCSQVCTALETLTFTLPEHRQAVASGGGAKAILEVLERHQDAEALLLRPCMDALWNLTFEDEAVDSTSEERGVERVAALMKKHAGEPELLGPACAVLLNLAVREQNRWKMVDSGCVALVANAMQQHAQHEELLELGCQALYMLAYHQDLKPLVLAAKGGDAAALAASCPRSAGRAQKWGRWLQEVLAC